MMEKFGLVIGRILFWVSVLHVAAVYSVGMFWMFGALK